MHPTLKAETATPPSVNRREQQKAFDRFRQQFNQEQPHETLEQKTPSSCYQSSPRVYPDRMPQPEYASHMKPKRVYPDGSFFWKGTQIFISKCLSGEFIGMEPLDDRYWKVNFAIFPLARFDSHKLILQPMPAGEINSYGNDGGMESEEKKKPFPSLPTPPWKARKQPRASHIPQLRRRLGFLFSPSSYNFNLDEKCYLLARYLLYRHARSHKAKKELGFSPCYGTSPAKCLP